MKPRVHPNALEAIRPKTIRPKANRPKMVQNNVTIAYIFSKTTPNPTPNPNRLSQQCLEAFTSPNNIILLNFNILSFGLIGFGLMDPPQLGAGLGVVLEEI